MKAAARRAAVERLEGRLLLSAVNPANLGKGDWIWEMLSCESALGVNSVQGVIDHEKSRGMGWITVKCGDGNSIWGQFNADLVNRAHTAGLKIFGWAYAYGGGHDPYGPSTVAGETAVAKNALSLGADGFIIDAESEYEALGASSGAAAATQYCQGIRAAYPDTFLAYAPFPIISYHSAFPYVAFGKYCDAAMPQDYWTDIGVTPQRMVSWMDSEWSTAEVSWINSGHADSVKPIVPIGQAFGGTPGSEITAFVNLLKTDPTPSSISGFGGVSFWSCQHHNADEWNAIGAISISRPALKFQVGDTVEVYDTGGAGLNAWSNVSGGNSVFEPDGTRGTVVFGPIYSNGYERWEVRYAGDTTDRWSAQDWLEQVPAASVVGRYVFYNDSRYDGNSAAADARDDSAIAPDKRALLPGQTATFANYTSYSRGIDGIMVDVANLPGAPTAADFTFKVGNSADPSTWPAAPSPNAIVTRALGAGATRIDLMWPDGAIADEWLQITVKADASTGLLAPDVFYFGNAIGETGNSPSDAIVNGTDELLARAHAASFLDPAPIASPYDFNRDGRVDAADQIIARNHATTAATALRLLAAPAAPLAAAAASAPLSPDAFPAFSPRRRKLR